MDDKSVSHLCRKLALPDLVAQNGHFVKRLIAFISDV
jgi:hypothetical protein